MNTTTKMPRSSRSSAKTCLVLLVGVLGLTTTFACDHHAHHNNNHEHHRHGTSNEHHDGAECNDDNDNAQQLQVDHRDLQTGFWVGDFQWPSQDTFRHSGARCTAREPNPTEVQESDDLVNAWFARGMNRRKLQQATINIPLYIHVITGRDRRTGRTVGAISDQQIQDQLQVLNDSFAPFFGFTLQDVTETFNDDWFTASVGGSAEDQMKAELRTGGPDALNLYTIEPNGGVLGWATLPSSYERSPTDDGVVVRYGTLPGGNVSPYNEGDTLVHEAGHWMGLFHTFQGGCGSTGDRIGDTAAEREPAFGCPVGRNTCNNGEGPDPIYNFMDYSDDDCMNEFTTGQFDIMLATFERFRVGEDGIDFVEGKEPEDEPVVIVAVPVATAAPAPAPVVVEEPAEEPQSAPATGSSFGGFSSNDGGGSAAIFFGFGGGNSGGSSSGFSGLFGFNSQAAPASTSSSGSPFPQPGKSSTFSLYNVNECGGDLLSAGSECSKDKQCCSLNCDKKVCQ